MKWFILYLAIVNLFAFFQMAYDKNRAKKHKWRVPEAQLFLAALIGGSIGSILGMQVFRHKTKHWYFVWGMPAILVVQAAIAVYFTFIR